jgi:hypothetical protein
MNPYRLLQCYLYEGTCEVDAYGLPIQDEGETEEQPNFGPCPNWCIRIDSFPPFRRKMYKRTPDGEVSKFKARYCVRGDLQEGNFDTYAPVVAWATVRLFLTLSLILDWKTVSIDFRKCLRTSHTEATCMDSFASRLSFKYWSDDMSSFEKVVILAVSGTSAVVRTCI